MSYCFCIGYIHWCLGPILCIDISLAPVNFDKFSNTLILYPWITSPHFYHPLYLFHAKLFN